MALGKQAPSQLTIQMMRIDWLCAAIWPLSSWPKSGGIISPLVLSFFLFFFLSLRSIIVIE